jgi:hypothetical protein
LRIAKPRSGKIAPALALTPPACEHGKPETAAFGYPRERSFLTTAGPALGNFGYPRHAPCS